MTREERNPKEIIAERIAKLFRDGDLVNLGIGVPMLVPKYIPETIHVTFHSENGMTAMGPTPELHEDADPDITNAGGEQVGILKHGAFFDSATSFLMIRGGHLDYTVLGAFQVDMEGNIANWSYPGKSVVGMGGAMDLVTGAKNVIVAMTHTNKGESKILKRCALPLTGKGVVKFIVTELGFFEVVPQGLLLREVQRNATVEQIKLQTEAEFIISRDLKIMDDVTFCK